MKNFIFYSLTILFIGSVQQLMAQSSSVAPDKIITPQMGIGTATPNAPLQFSNNTFNRKIVLWQFNNNDNQFYGFGVNPGVLRYQTNTLADDHVFYAGASPTVSNELMRIKGNGNVGIGTATPNANLDITGSLKVSSYQATHTQGAWLEWNKDNGGGKTYLLNQKGLGGGGMVFGEIDNANSITERINIDANGNVGIGIPTPAAKLTVLNNPTNPSPPNTSSTGIFRIAVSNNEGIDFGKMGSGASGWIQSGLMGMYTTSLSLQPVGGNVGIGTVNPLATLDVNGDVNISGKIINENYVPPTLLNSWVNNGGTFAVAGYYKDKENRVQLKGLIKDGNAANTTLFNLPAGYRPSETLVFAVINGNGFGRVDVYPNGDVKILLGTSTFTSLSGITFRAEQ